MRRAGYIGGRNPNQYERKAALDRNIAHLPILDLGWQHQCRCGDTAYSVWRGRIVCRRCGRWYEISAPMLARCIDQQHNHLPLGPKQPPSAAKGG